MIHLTFEIRLRQVYHTLGITEVLWALMSHNHSKICNTFMYISKKMNFSKHNFQDNLKAQRTKCKQMVNK